MELKKYNAPDIEVMEMTTASMIATSGDLNAGGTEGNTGGATGGSGQGAHIASRQYFDGWDLDDTEE